MKDFKNIIEAERKKLEEMEKKRQPVTSEKILKITKDKLSKSKEMQVFGMKKRKVTVNVTSTKEKQTIFEMFKNRKKAIYGLTKAETLAEFTNKSLNDLFKLTPKERELQWNKFKGRCKALRNDEMIGIISQQLSAGVVLRDLKDGQWGDRPLKKKQHVYFRCSELEDATGFRKEMDKIATGVNDAGDQIVKLSEDHQKNKEIIQVMNGGQRAK